MVDYRFSDTELAARRLAFLAGVFDPLSKTFLEAAFASPTELALDLGCGPGCTTRLLAEVTRARRVVGLDSSETFIALASRDAPKRVTFLHHDVTTVPFPVEPADLIYCRLLLTHLNDPLTVVDRWAEQLRDGGRLLLDEVEWIRPEIGLFSDYIAIVTAMFCKQ